MATWLTHLRVADRLIDKIEISDSSSFFAGSIAPDTNISPDISHWCTSGDKTTCDVQDFYCKYILDKNTSSDFDFYLGYYVHLLTDISWHKKKIEPLKRYDMVFIKKALLRVLTRASPMMITSPICCSRERRRLNYISRANGMSGRNLLFIISEILHRDKKEFG